MRTLEISTLHLTLTSFNPPFVTFRKNNPPSAQINCLVQCCFFLLYSFCISWETTKKKTRNASILFLKRFLIYAGVTEKVRTSRAVCERSTSLLLLLLYSAFLKTVWEFAVSIGSFHDTLNTFQQVFFVLHSNAASCDLFKTWFDHRMGFHARLQSPGSKRKHNPQS